MITSHARAGVAGLWLVALRSSRRAASAQTEPTSSRTRPPRAEALQAERAEKAQETQPHQQNNVERGLHFFEDRAVFILDREGSTRSSAV